MSSADSCFDLNDFMALEFQQAMIIQSINQACNDRALMEVGFVCHYSIDAVAVWTGDEPIMWYYNSLQNWNRNQFLLHSHANGIDTKRAWIKAQSIKNG